MKNPFLLLAAATAFCALPAFAEDITVSAAASLTNAFSDLAKAYEHEHPEDKIQLNFAGSGALLQQILHGAPVDVFASADTLRMDKAEQAHKINPQTRHIFAKNTLVAIVPAQNRQNYKDLAAFVTAPGIQRLAIANVKTVPVGRYSQLGLSAAKLWTVAKAKAIPAENVRQVLDYVARNEVDGGFVYRTDAALMPQKVRVLFEVPVTVALDYPIAIVQNSSHQKAAARFVAYVRSPKGEAILARYGFLKP